MTTKLFKVLEGTGQEPIAHLLSVHGVQAIPVVDREGHMKGIVTADDVMDMLREEDTAKIQKIGGMEALDEPYLETGFLAMIRKRAGWLIILFLGEMLTATAMSHYERQIEEAVVLEGGTLVRKTGRLMPGLAGVLNRRALGCPEKWNPDPGLRVRGSHASSSVPRSSQTLETQG